MNFNENNWFPKFHKDAVFEREIQTIIAHFEICETWFFCWCETCGNTGRLELSSCIADTKLTLHMINEVCANDSDSRASQTWKSARNREKDQSICCKKRLRYIEESAMNFILYRP
jgi:hypothetical protein